MKNFFFNFLKIAKKTNQKKEVRDIVQEAVIKTIPEKRNAKRQNGCLRRPYK